MLVNLSEFQINTIIMFSVIYILIISIFNFFTTREINMRNTMINLLLSILFVISLTKLS